MNRWILCRATDAAVSLRAMRCGEEKKIAPADAMMIYRGRGVVQFKSNQIDRDERWVVIDQTLGKKVTISVIELSLMPHARRSYTLFPAILFVRGMGKASAELQPGEEFFFELRPCSWQVAVERRSP